MPCLAYRLRSDKRLGLRRNLWNQSERAPFFIDFVDFALAHGAQLP